ncbi:SDR family NAD(P)-dependent oxidoreductase [Streptomyces sp. CRN 30]|uniref:SDR family NAD(P)-dependent oxidoreductase n=1 Tax=Streptomyces sp. CRN 30 TaxID=3075613 RepID=UPI002A80F39D|nr:SDR family NAD(P)-dependent oxidoreductase [Streptomyces sp. CRN 30]
MAGWSVRDIPDQNGRVAVVTGADGGLGYLAARELARRGARLVLACRSERRGNAAVTRLAAEVPGARAELRRLDLADLASVRQFAEGLPYARVGLLVNSAGVTAAPRGTTTADGYETHFGVNHLGHFALTGLLLPALVAGPGARVVTVSSQLHLLADVDLSGRVRARRSGRWTACARSRSANLLFTHELARRLALNGTPVVAVAAHPGCRVPARPPEARVLPVLYAATTPGIRPDSYTGPSRAPRGGAPVPSWRAPRTRDDATAERLWAASERMTGVAYEVLKR